MVLTKDSLDKVTFSYATVSVGSPEDPLEKKLEAISSAGFTAIELGFPEYIIYLPIPHTY